MRSLNISYGNIDSINEKINQIKIQREKPAFKRKTSEVHLRITKYVCC